MEKREGVSLRYTMSSQDLGPGNIPGKVLVNWTREVGKRIGSVLLMLTTNLK